MLCHRDVSVRLVIRRHGQSLPVRLRHQRFDGTGMVAVQLSR
jgi:hypothetical protein